MSPLLNPFVANAAHVPGCMEFARFESAEPNASCDHRKGRTVIADHNNFRVTEVVVALLIKDILEKIMLLKIIFSLFS
jgi:hypothetical protein